MGTGLAIVRPPNTRQPEEARDESEKAPVFDVDASKILAPLSDYIPLLDETKSKTADPICLEIAAECDRLRVLIDLSYHSTPRKSGEVAGIVAKRLSALRILGQRLGEVEGKEQVRVELSTISAMLTIIKEIMRETGVAQETREIVFQKLLTRVSSLRDGSSTLGI